MPRDTSTATAGRPASPLSEGVRPVLCGLLILAACFAISTASAGASVPHAKGFRVVRTCRLPRPGRAGCFALRLLSTSLTASDLTANKATYRREVSHHERVKALRKTPFPGFLTPEKLHSAYALPDTTEAGASQTVAVVDAFDDPTAEEDLAVYDKEFGLGECTTANGCFKKINQNGKSSPLPEVEGEWATEISIDVQMVRAICQNCHIVLVETNGESFNDLGAGVNAAVAAGATVVSNSYGGPEESAFTGLAGDWNHPGLVIAASSGDCGYFNKACKGDAQKANFPADSPNVVAVGGTSLTESQGSWTSTVWSEGGSGCSSLFSAATWQLEAENFGSTGCGSGRGVVDVSAIGDPNTGVDVYDTTPESVGAPTGWSVWGGTSVASPIVGGEFGLAGGALGVSYPASTLYTHLGQSNDLYDVTNGSNGSCGALTICKAVSGYDGPTGVGSPLGLGAFSLGETPVNTSPPTISGVAQQGETLGSTDGEWSEEPIAFADQWERCSSSGSDCVAIGTAKSPSYTVTSADVGSRLRVSVTASNSHGPGSPAHSETTAVVPGESVPAITSFTPSGITGSVITIEGSGFSGVTQVEIGKLSASFKAVSASKLEATVPNGAASGKIEISASGGTAKSKSKFSVTLSIKSFKPGSGGSGTVVTIKGVGFNGSSVVRFAGVAGNVTSVSSSKIKVVVPAGAGSGPITVTNTTSPAGTVASAGGYTP
jgi:hypothetical protein